MEKHWSIEAGSSLQQVLDQPDIPPLLRWSLTGDMSWQVRSETTVGRSLRAPGIAPRWYTALLALGATVEVEGTEVGLEEMSAGRPAALHIPLVGPAIRWGAASVSRTPADVAIVAAVAVVELDDGLVRQARIGLTGVWPRPAQLAQAAAQLAGGPLTPTAIAQTAEAVAREVAPPDDLMGSAEYRREMAGLLTRRALEQCLE